MNRPLLLTAEQAALLEKRVLAETRPRVFRGVPLAVLLFGVTALATSYAGYVMAVSPTLDLFSGESLARVAAQPSLLLLGLPFSLALLSILLAHEMGHYLAASWHGLDVSPPYFLPGPTIIGTFGAFIRVRSPIPSRRILFDVGASGPLAGFVMACIHAVIGTLTVQPSALLGSWPGFTPPLALRAILSLRFEDVPDALFLPASPGLMAAWVGFFLTLLNLLPVGQLDGGHVLHAWIGRRSRAVGPLAFVGVGVLFVVTLWPGWLVWAVLLLILGLRHPVVPDPRRLGPGRVALAVTCVVVFVLCFVAKPIHF